MASSSKRRLRWFIGVPAAAVALLVISYFFYFAPQTSREEAPSAPVESASATPGPDESEPQPDSQAIRPQSGLQPIADAAESVASSSPLSPVEASPSQQQPAEAPRAIPPTVRDVLTILGTVSDVKGEPIVGAYLKWLPASPGDLAGVNNDPSVLAMEGRNSSEDLDRILALGRSARSGSGGFYRLRIPNRKPYGTLSAWSPGSEMGLTQVAPPPGGATDGKSGTTVQIDFTLRRAGEIRGRVTERESGRPAPGMVVKAMIADSDLSFLKVLSGEKGANAVVRKDGAYTIAGLLPGVYQLTVASGSSDYAPLSFSKARNVTVVEGRVAEGEDFEVEIGGRLRALILGPEGKPLPQAECDVMDGFLLAAVAGRYFSGFDVRMMDAMWLSQGKSGSSQGDGRCLFRGLPLGRSYAAGASYPDLAPSISETVSVTREQPDAEVEIRLEHGAVLSGQAVFDNGRPATQIDLRLKSQHPTFRLGRATGNWTKQTDSEGRFRFENLAQGTYDLSLFGTDPELSLLRTFELDAGQVMESVRLVIPAGDVTLVGTVSDHRNQPVADARLNVSSKAVSRMGRSREDGSFRIEGLQPGPLAVSVSHPDYAQLWQKLEDVEPGEKRIQLILEANGWIIGRVVGPDGQPIRSGGSVRFLSGSDSGYGWSPLAGKPEPLDEQGGFRVKAPPGSYIAKADVPGFAPSQSELVQVEAAQTTSEVVIQVGEGAAVTGIVVLSESGPVEGAAIILKKADEPPTFSAFQDEAAPKSGPDGRFRIPNQVPGEYSIAATHDEYVDSEPMELVLEEGRTADVTLTLSTGGGVVGRVMDGERPMGNIRLNLGGMDFRKTVVSEEDGSFRMLGVPPDLYVLMVGLGYGAMDDFPNFDVRILTVTVPPSEVVEVEVDYSLGSRVYGQVRNLPADQNYAQVTLRRPGGPAAEDLDYADRRSQFQNLLYLAGMGWIGSDGIYQIRGIPPGRYILEIPRQIRLVEGKPSRDPRDRIPLYRAEVVVSTSDLRHDIVIP